MNSVIDHYNSLLAPIYPWMTGGADAALNQGAAELARFNVSRATGAVAVDLGAGFGMHAIPLARLGYAVTAVDSSRLLLSQLLQLSKHEGHDIHAIEADVLDFATHVYGPVALILCMGDTLTHLSSTDGVERLCSQVAACLAPGGRFIVTFRDYSRPPRGDDRFIPVRSDYGRIHTCFLEERGDGIVVHDIVHERQGDTWTTRVGHYPKLRLAPDNIVARLERLGLSVTRDCGPSGMVRIAAVAAASRPYRS